MENIGYIALSHQSVLRQQMAITANNIANMTTPGFKTQSILFQEHLADVEESEKISQVIDQNSYRNMSAGPIEQTFNPFDFAIQGDGYFSVQTENGIRYTRAGNFTLDNLGQIVTQNGNPVLGEGGAPITVDPEDTTITVTADGSINSQNGEIGRFQLTRFEVDEILNEAGNNLYDSQGATGQPAVEAQVLQGAIEGSNVQPVLEMTRMIEILRVYQSVSQLMSNDHDRQRSAIRTLTQRSG